MEGEQLSDADKSKFLIPENWRNNLYSNRHLWLIIILLLLVAILWFFFGKKNKTNEVKPISVVAALSSSRDVPIYLAALGAVTPVYTVTIKTQINGILMKVLYKEGQLVKKNQLLAQIDKRPYEALLLQYQGDLERDRALLANAKVDLRRYQTLWRQNSISQQTLATQQSLVEQYEGAVKIDMGLIQSTKVNLIYCDIISPIDGRIGLRLVDPGNFVQTTDTQGLAVVTTNDPITVIFTIAEDYVPQVLPKAYARKEMLVQAYDRQQKQLLATGKLLALDNQIDSTTGTVKLRAVFNNKDNKLFPNQFVNAQILVRTLKNAVVVPTAAIQHTTTEDFVYLINNNQTVTVKPVKMGPASGNDTVIKSGLLAGQSVVVEGADKLMDGSKVNVQISQPLKPPHLAERHKMPIIAAKNYLTSRSVT